MTKVAFLGPKGTYTHQFGDCEVHPQSSISQCFQILSDKQVDYAVVPFENSTNGQVVYTYDLIRDWFSKGCDFKIVGEQFVAIHHFFLSKANSLSKVKKVYSHPQVWGQVTKFASKLDASVIKEDVSSTSKAAQMVDADETGEIAAISSEMASKLYNLPVMVANIEDISNNTTRFLILGYNQLEELDKESSNDANYITSLLFTLNHNDPGALCTALDTLRQNNVNMSSINSRPSHLKQWQYIFFVEVHGNPLIDENVDRGIQELNKVCDLTVLGTFKRNWRYGMSSQ